MRMSGIIGGSVGYRKERWTSYRLPTVEERTLGGCHYHPIVLMESLSGEGIGMGSTCLIGMYSFLLNGNRHDEWASLLEMMDR